MSNCFKWPIIQNIMSFLVFASLSFTRPFLSRDSKSTFDLLTGRMINAIPSYKYLIDVHGLFVSAAIAIITHRMNERRKKIIIRNKRWHTQWMSRMENDCENIDRPCFMFDVQQWWKWWSVEGLSVSLSNCVMRTMYNKSKIHIHYIYPLWFDPIHIHW